MRVLFLILAVAFVCSSVFSEETYTNEDVKRMMYEPGTVSYATPPLKAKKRANPGGIINCAEAVENQTGQINIGHPEVCIEVPKSYNTKLVVNSWIGNDNSGYYYIDENSKIDFTKWKNKLDNSN